MSVVTNVIVAYAAIEEDDRVLNGLNAVLERLGTEQRFVTPFVGGGKNLERPVLLGAFNYLPLAEFLHGVRALRWVDPGGVQVFIRDEHSEGGYRLAIGQGGRPA